MNASPFARPFAYEALPGRVIFGPGEVRRLPAELERLGASRVLVLCTAGRREQAQAIAAAAGGRIAGMFAEAPMHVPVAVARAARAEAQRIGADACLAIGGGSTIGLGKAIALEIDLALVAVPTTYGGSEVTPIYGITAGHRKTTGRDRRVLPKLAIYDPELTLSLPPAVSAASGMNAIAHAVEALYSADANPVASLMAVEAIRALRSVLPQVVRDPAGLGARTEAFYGSWLAGSVLGAVGMALHHKLCHTLGGAYNLPHAPLHAVILPHAAAYNAPAVPQAMAAVAGALGAPRAPEALFDLAGELGIERSLAGIGMRAADLDAAAALASQDPYVNPRPVERAAVRALLQAAYDGRRPSVAGETSWPTTP